MTSQAKKFSERLYAEVVAGRGVESCEPTPEHHEWFNSWIHGVREGTRGSWAVAEPDPEPDSPSAQMSNYIRSVARPAGDED